MIISDENKKVLSKIIENFDLLLKNNDVDEIMERLDDAIISNILANNDEPDATGKKWQKIYDEILDDNYELE